jgi:mRNA-degrading endonuclease RelE of RelBE toxin-antitoxin system
MEVIIKKSFVKDIAVLPDDIKLQIKQLILQLENADHIFDINTDLKYLEGGPKNEKYLRFRMGRYRIGAILKDNAIILVVVGSRGDFYKNFP